MPTTDDTKTADDTKAAEDEAPADDEATKDEVPPEEEPMADPVDQGPALRKGGTLNLGVCHFGTGSEEPASVLATRSDGTGWIGVCEEHTKDAEEQGFVIEESEKAGKSKD